MNNANLGENCIKPFIIVFFCVALLCSAPPVYATYFLSYDIHPLSDRSELPHVSLNQDGFSFSDVYDQYSESTWQVASAVDDGSGGVDVTYSFGQTPWESYWSGISFTFQILSNDGNLNPEPVSVDAWGGLHYEHQMYFDPYRSTTACCGSDPVDLHSPMWSYDEFPSYDGDNPRVMSGFGSFDDTYTLYTNTVYDIEYRTEFYVESMERFHSPLHFDTWDEYYDFIDESGGSGISYASAEGFTNFNLVLSSDVPPVSVPEPSTILLLTAGLVVCFGAKRKLS